MRLKEASARGSSRLSPVQAEKRFSFELNDSAAARRPSAGATRQWPALRGEKMIMSIDALSRAIRAPYLADQHC